MVRRGGAWWVPSLARMLLAHKPLRMAPATSPDGSSAVCSLRLSCSHGCSRVGSGVWRGSGRRTDPVVRTGVGVGVGVGVGAKVQGSGPRFRVMEKVRVRRRGECQLHLGSRGEPRDEHAVLLLLVLHGEALAPPLAAHLKRRPHARPGVPQAAVADERGAGGGLSGEMARHRVAHAALIGSRPPPVGTDRDEVRAKVEALLGWWNMMMRERESRRSE